MLSCYTRRRYIGNKFFISNPTTYFDNDIYDCVESGDYMFNEDELALMYVSDGITKVDGTRVLTEIGWFSLKEITNDLKYKLVMIFLSNNHIEAVVNINDRKDKLKQIDTILNFAEEYDIGVMYEFSSSFNTGFLNRKIIVDGCIETTLDNFLLVSDTITYKREPKDITFKGNGHTIDLTLDTNITTIKCSHYELALCKNIISSCIENGGEYEDFMILSDKSLYKYRMVDEENIPKSVFDEIEQEYKGKILVKFDSFGFEDKYLFNNIIKDEYRVLNLVLDDKNELCHTLGECEETISLGKLPIVTNSDGTTSYKFFLNRKPIQQVFDETLMRKEDFRFLYNVK